ncbi:hypothetical protein GWI33_003952 [Rhynchophorus ferrugineus]|uniref:Uncharacterized protein n=1 Tax=Rhynchophorus ferrugineus TaxID=354439 RepID=A0A834HJT1_RHYFE|nr:hypothetical protein GWI33_003952 [Rhynchophorus ferrugineus]
MEPEEAKAKSRVDGHWTYLKDALIDAYLEDLKDSAFKGKLQPVLVDRYCKIGQDHGNWNHWLVSVRIIKIRDLLLQCYDMIMTSPMTTIF